MSKRIKSRRLVSKFGGKQRKRLHKNFSQLLASARSRSKLSKKVLGQMLGRSNCQINRYETSFADIQFPTVDVFAKLCVILQIDPLEALGLFWEELEAPVESIDVWHIRVISARADVGLYWSCPRCCKKNVRYFEKFPLLAELQQTTFACESCGSNFTHLTQLSEETLNFCSFTEVFQKKQNYFRKAANV